MTQLRPRHRRARSDDATFAWLFARYCAHWHPAIAAIEAHEALRLGLVKRRCRPT